MNTVPDCIRAKIEADPDNWSYAKTARPLIWEYGGGIMSEGMIVAYNYTKAEKRHGEAYTFHPLLLPSGKRTMGIIGREIIPLSALELLALSAT